MEEMQLDCMGTAVTVSQPQDEERLKEAELIINLGKSPRTSFLQLQSQVEQQISFHDAGVGTETWNQTDPHEVVISVSGNQQAPGEVASNYCQSDIFGNVGTETENLQPTGSKAGDQPTGSEVGNQPTGSGTENQATGSESTNQPEAGTSSSGKAHRIRSRPGVRVRHVYRCYICKADFDTTEELLKHRMDHRTYICGTCDMAFPDNQQLAAHQQEHLQLEVRSYRCNMCLEVFNDIDMLNLHKKIHESEGPFVCDICSLVFSVKRAFLHHISGHGSNDMKRKRQEVRCEVCKKIFPEANKLRRHMLYHNNVRQYACPLCGRDFIEKAKLQRHMIVHSGLRDFQCPICQKKFTLKHNLTQHMNIHKGVKPFICPTCNKGFTQKIVMQRHIKNVH